MCKAYDIDVPDEELEKREIEIIIWNLCGAVNPYSNHICFKCKCELHVDANNQYDDADYEEKMLPKIQKLVHKADLYLFPTYQTGREEDRKKSTGRKTIQ